MQQENHHDRRGFLKAAAGSGLAALGASALAQSFDFRPNQRYPDPAVLILDPAFARYRIYSSTVEQLGTGAGGGGWPLEARLTQAADLVCRAAWPDRQHQLEHRERLGRQPCAERCLVGEHDVEVTTPELFAGVALRHFVEGQVPISQDIERGFAQQSRQRRPDRPRS